MKIAEWRFASNAERDAFVSRTWAKRRLKWPGVYIVPGGDRLVVTRGHIALLRRTKR